MSFVPSDIPPLENESRKIRLSDLELPDPNVPVASAYVLTGPSLEERTQRELALRADRDQYDERTPLEKLFDLITRARIAYYRPDAMPAERRDIVCLCCGTLYRPDDPTDGENIYLCLSCTKTRQGT